MAKRVIHHLRQSFVLQTRSFLPFPSLSLTKYSPSPNILLLFLLDLGSNVFSSNILMMMVENGDDGDNEDDDNDDASDEVPVLDVKEKTIFINISPLPQIF